jgi:hypothetical protein
MGELVRITSDPEQIRDALVGIQVQERLLKRALRLSLEARGLRPVASRRAKQIVSGESKRGRKAPAEQNSAV